MTNLLKQTKMPLVMKCVLSLLILCGLASLFVLFTHDEAPSALLQILLWLGLLGGMAAAIVAYSYAGDKTSAEATAHAKA